jgi:Zn-dependent protease with chaperone function
MDFFSAQERSKRTSRYLLLFFFLAFAAVAVVTALALGFALGWYTDRFAASATDGTLMGYLGTHIGTLFSVAGAVLGIMVLASLYRHTTLSRGGGQVARMLGASEVAGDESDPLHRRLINVVEEMAIASGLPVPEIYVLEQESGINAFAAGLTHSDAAVAVTRGALERLSRAELQGVIAHEFSHILNGDMRLNQRLMGFSYGILVLSIIGRWLLRSARFGRRSRNSGAAVALGIGAALTVIGAIGVLLSRLIKAAVSRQRETLADASAVQFTREPAARAGAQKKIGGYTAKLSAVDDEEVAHMLFERRARLLSGLFATHPPLVERIRVLDPRFEPSEFLAPDAYPLETATPDSAASAFAGAQVSLEAVIEHAGRIEGADVGEAVRRALPATLYDAAHSRESSLLLVLALALSPERDSAARQIQLLTQQLGAARAERSLKLQAELAQLDRRLWLPLLELAMPMVKQRPAEQLDYLFDVVRQLDAIDEGQRLFEYVLVRVLAAYLDALPEPPLTTTRRAAKLRPADALGTLLGVVAAYGHDEPEAARAAYAAGAALLDAKITLPAFPGIEAGRDLVRLDAALTRLAELGPRAKRRVLESLRVTIEHDSRIETAEVELFRAIAATLNCPSPPQLGPAATHNA